MADVYLTKIERKTIFTRALIYVLILFAVADISVTGPFFVNFIPLLYVLSILISVRGVDKVLTGIIGAFTVFMASLITNGFNITTFLITLNAVVQLGLGMLSAHIIHEFVLDHRLVKYIKLKKKILLIVLLILFTILSFLISAAVNGDLISYFKSKTRLEDYIAKVYDIEYEIKKVTYNRNLPGKYSFVISSQGEEVYFVPVLNIAFKDVNQEQRLQARNTYINSEISNKLEDFLKEKSTLNSNCFKFIYKYNKVGIVPDTLIATITADSENDNVYNEIADSVIKLLEIEPTITEFEITLNKKNLHINSKNITMITPEYIRDGFNIEDLDE